MTIAKIIFEALRRIALFCSENFADRRKDRESLAVAFARARVELSPRQAREVFPRLAKQSHPSNAMGHGDSAKANDDVHIDMNDLIRHNRELLRFRPETLGYAVLYIENIIAGRQRDTIVSIPVGSDSRDFFFPVLAQNDQRIFSIEKRVEALLRVREDVLRWLIPSRKSGASVGSFRLPMRTRSSRLFTLNVCNVGTANSASAEVASAQGLQRKAQFYLDFLLQNCAIPRNAARIGFVPSTSEKTSCATLRKHTQLVRLKLLNKRRWPTARASATTRFLA